MLKPAFTFLFLLFSICLLSGVASSGETGEKLVSMSYVNADIVAVLRELSRKADVNIVIDKEIHGNITLDLRNVPWLGALNLITKTHGFDYKVIEGTIVVGTEKSLEKIDRYALSTRTHCYVTQVLPLEHADPTILAEILKKIFPDAEIMPDSRLRALIVTADYTTIKQMKNLVYGTSE